jgi:parallel beta-helix repeat protein
VKIDNNTIEYNTLNGAYLANYNGTFENNTVQNNFGNGASLVDSSGPVLQYNNITNNGGNGINGSASVPAAITANNISFNKHGIHFVDSTPATSQNNITSNSEDGIYFLRSGNGTSISNNTISNNSKNGIWVNASWVLIDNNTIDHNGLNGTYLVNYNGTLENNTVLNNSGSGVYLIDSSGSFLQYNNITLNGIHGVYSYYSSITFRGNNITYNSPSGLCPPYCSYYGMYADHGSTLQIDHNRIENNTAHGVLLYYATQVDFTDNIVSDHTCSICFGIRTRGGSVNMLGNTMVGNDGSHFVTEEYNQPSRIENNTMVGGGTGIHLDDSGFSIMIANNSISELGRGMLLSDSSARVFNNQIWNLTGVAIQLEDDSNEDVFNNTISNAQTGISLDVDSSEVGSPYIHNNTITGDANSRAGIYVEGQGTATPTIKYNTITNHTTYPGYGIQIYGSNAHPEIINNTISNNFYGIHLQNGGNATVHGCNIFDSSQYGAYNWDSTIKVNATENWWGDSSGPTHRDNPGGSGDRVSNDIKFDPWLTTPAF